MRPSSVGWERDRQVCLGGVGCRKERRHTPSDLISQTGVGTKIAGTLLIKMIAQF